MSLSVALARACAEGARRRSGPVALCGALDVDPEALLLAAPTPWCFWDDGCECVLGIGAFQQVSARGETRFAEIRERGDELLRTIRVVGDAVPQRLFGTFAFSPGESPEFAVFGDASFVLPRLTLMRRDGRTFASFVLDET